MTKHTPPEDVGLPNDAMSLEGELLATFADLQARYCTEHGSLYLAWTALDCLWKHVQRHHGIEALLEFYEGTIDETNAQVKSIRGILDEDFKARLN